MDVTTKAVALKATDYKENDKLVCLYSLEQGKISVHAKGVRKGGAKLKFACDQFCFGQYELAQNGTRFTLKTCEQLHSFYELREDVFAYIAACVIAECIVNYTEEGEADAGVFVTLLKALEQLLGGVNALLITLKFILEFLKLEGFSLDFSKCSVCGASNVPLFLDSQRGGVVCDGCRSADSVRVDSAVVSLCKMVESLPMEKIKNLNVADSLSKQALQVCGRYIAHSFSPLKSLSELLKL